MTGCFHERTPVGIRTEIGLPSLFEPLRISWGESLEYSIEKTTLCMRLGCNPRPINDWVNFSLTLGCEAEIHPIICWSYCCNSALFKLVLKATKPSSSLMGTSSDITGSADSNLWVTLCFFARLLSLKIISILKWIMGWVIQRFESSSSN